VDLVCAGVGNTCADPSTLAACAQDADACFYESSSSPCTDGACSGGAGAASCCTNACTVGTQCLSGSTLQTCAVASNGCTALATSMCSSGNVCERAAPASCLDPNWAEWPMPNAPWDVMDGAPNATSYTDNGDQTVTDKVTGLMWQQTNTSTFRFSNAKNYCTTLTLGGHTDWRLPTVIELASLVDIGVPYSMSTTAMINTTFFPGTSNYRFWTSTLLAGSSIVAWYIDFYDGSIYNQNVLAADGVDAPAPDYYVRCVR
jgi:hypothetical protein